MQRRGLGVVVCDGGGGTGGKLKREGICVYVYMLRADSLCCTVETNTTL